MKCFRFSKHFDNGCCLCCFFFLSYYDSGIDKNFNRLDFKGSISLDNNQDIEAGKPGPLSHYETAPQIFNCIHRFMQFGYEVGMDVNKWAGHCTDACAAAINSGKLLAVEWNPAMFGMKCMIHRVDRMFHIMKANPFYKEFHKKIDHFVNYLANSKIRTDQMISIAKQFDDPSYPGIPRIGSIGPTRFYDSAARTRAYVSQHEAIVAYSHYLQRMYVFIYFFFDAHN